VSGSHHVPAVGVFGDNLIRRTLGNPVFGAGFLVEIRKPLKELLPRSFLTRLSYSFSPLLSMTDLYQ
jgi:hypothetical protein